MRGFFQCFHAGVFIIVLICSCSKVDDQIDEAPNPKQQFIENKKDIAAFFGKRGLSIDTTRSGVRYAVIPSENGDDGEVLQPGDHVELNYVSYLINGQMLGTTLQSVVDTTDRISRPAAPLVLTYTSTGWAFEELFNTVRVGAFVTDGFKDGVTAAFNKGRNGQGDFRVGDWVVLGVPAKATGVTLQGKLIRTPVVPNRAIIYEVVLSKIIK